MLCLCWIRCLLSSLLFYIAFTGNVLVWIEPNPCPSHHPVSIVLGFFIKVIVVWKCILFLLLLLGLLVRLSIGKRDKFCCLSAPFSGVFVFFFLKKPFFQFPLNQKLLSVFYIDHVFIQWYLVSVCVCECLKHSLLDRFFSWTCFLLPFYVAGLIKWISSIYTSALWFLFSSYETIHPSIQSYIRLVSMSTYGAPCFFY